jgi:hypothetical protein
VNGFSPTLSNTNLSRKTAVCSKRYVTFEDRTTGTTTSSVATTATATADDKH